MSIAQNAKTLLETIYEYERLVNSKAPKKEISRVREYAKKIILSIRQEMLNG